MVSTTPAPIKIPRSIWLRETEIGPLPTDWRVEPVERFATIATGGRNTQDRVDDGLYPFFVRSQTVEHINTYSFDGEAVLTAGDGVGTGKIFHYIKGKCDIHQRVYRVSDFRSDVSGYYFYLFFSANFYARIMQMTAKSSVDSVRREMISQMLIALPPKEEQAAIAEALLDADALVEALESLIAKKGAVKRGAMQELLSGRRRLTGFGAKWELVRLSDIADIRSGGTPSTARPDFWDGHVPWCTPTDITALEGAKYLRDTRRKITDSGLKASSAEWVPAGSVVMTSRATIGECAINVLPMTTNQGFKNLVPRAEIDVEFLYYFMTTQKERLVALCGGSTFLEIGKTQLTSFEIRIPGTKAEQVAISTILAEMDSELQALTVRLTKARQIKQGMMQALLTGQVRLV